MGYEWEWEGDWDLGLSVLGLFQTKAKSGVPIRIDQCMKNADYQSVYLTCSSPISRKRGARICHS